MEYMIWIGAALTLAGVVLLVWCIVQAVKARRADLDDAAMRARLQRLTAVNMGAMGLSGLGLALVAVGATLT